MQIGDVKGAFLESDALDRPEGPLYMQQPTGGIPGVHADSIVRMDLPLYGLNDAPKRWFRKFVKVAQGA
eukprot:8354028-Pyramimonas_sp.AAC.1